MAIWRDRARAHDAGLSGIGRYIATVETAKHRVFQFLHAATLPDTTCVIAIGWTTRAYSRSFQSRIHVAWALAAGGRARLRQRSPLQQVPLLRPLPLPRPRRPHPRPPARPRRAARRPPQAPAGGASRPDPHPDVQRAGEAPGRRAHRGPGPRDLRQRPRRHPPPAPRRDRRRDRPRLRLAGRPLRRRRSCTASSRSTASAPPRRRRASSAGSAPSSRTPTAAPPPPPPRPSSTSARPPPPRPRSPPGRASCPSRWPPSARRSPTPARPPPPTSPAASAAPAPPASRRSSKPSPPSATPAPRRRPLHRLSRRAGPGVNLPAPAHFRCMGCAWVVHNVCIEQTAVNDCDCDEIRPRVTLPSPGLIADPQPTARSIMRLNSASRSGLASSPTWAIRPAEQQLGEAVHHAPGGR